MLVSLRTLVNRIQSKSFLLAGYGGCLLASGGIVNNYPTPAVAAQDQFGGRFQLPESDRPANPTGVNGMAQIPNVDDEQSSLSSRTDLPVNPYRSSLPETFTSQPLPPAPSAPQSILMPQSPTEESFTRPEEETGMGAETFNLPGERNTASGTFTAQDSPTSQFENPRRFDRPMQDGASDFPPALDRPAAPVVGNNLRERTFNAQPFDSTISDANVQPTTFNQAIAQPELQIDLAKQLISRYLVDSAPNPLPGQPTRLVEMFAQPIASNQRQKMVSQYWETWYDWASLLSRAEHVSWLDGIVVPSSPSDAALLTAAKSQANDQLLAAEIQLGKSQSKLMDFLPNRMATNNGSLTPILPLPSDQPLIQKYNTNYDLYQSYQRIPLRLRGIDSMLPKTLKLICNRATTVQLAVTAAESARQSLANRQTGLAVVLEAGRIWRTSEQDLIASVTSYNQAIGDYSLSVTDGGQAPETIVAMLIGRPKPAAVFPNPGTSQTADNFSGSQGGNRFNQPTNGPAGLQPLPGRPTGFEPSTSNSNLANNRPDFGSPPSRPADGNFAPPRQFDNGGFVPNLNSSPPTDARSANANFGQPNNDFGR